MRRFSDVDELRRNLASSLDALVRARSIPAEMRGKSPSRLCARADFCPRHPHGDPSTIISRPVGNSRPGEKNRRLDLGAALQKSHIDINNSFTARVWKLCVPLGPVSRIIPRVAYSAVIMRAEPVVVAPLKIEIVANPRATIRTNLVVSRRLRSTATFTVQRESEGI